MRFLVFFGFLIAGLMAFGWSVLSSFNHFRDVERDFAGQCIPVNGLEGPEDLQIDNARGRFFVSSRDRRDEQSRGAIHLFDIGDPLSDAGWRDRTGGVPEAFQPLGIHYFENDEVRRLFVVNEANAGIELFDVLESGDLTHLETFRERRVTSPNDVVAVGPREFFVTNDVKPGRNNIVAPFLYLSRAGAGELLYSDGTVWRVAVENLQFANGVNASADGAMIYVAETSGNAVRIYDRNLETGRIQLKSTVSLDSAPDNINVDSAGMLWVGAMPKPLAVPRLERDLDAIAPSQIVKIDPQTGVSTTIYKDSGDEISWSTAAARDGSTLLIGSLFDKKFLICNLPPETR